MFIKTVSIITFCLVLTGCFTGFKRACPNTTNSSWNNLPATIKPLNLDESEMIVLNLAIQNWNTSYGKTLLKIDMDSYNTIQNGGISMPAYNQGRTYTTSISGTIVRSRIYINENLSRSTDLEALYIHELGHFLGLKHIDGTVMNPGLPDYYHRVEIEDEVLNTVRCLYDQ